MMFADSLLDAHPASSRRWTTLISYAGQLAALGVLIISPLLYTSGLPQLRLAAPLLGVPIAAPPQPQQHATAPAHGSSIAQPSDGRIHAPGKIPDHIAIGPDPAPLSAQSYGVPGSTGLPGTGVPNGIFVGTAAPPPPAPPHTAPSGPIRVSNLTPADAISQPRPQYPQIARTAHVEGAVVLSAVIARDGTIERLHVVSGHPWLAQAALDAVSRWRYRPYTLNGAPVEVETQITVVFRMDH